MKTHSTSSYVPKTTLNHFTRFLFFFLGVSIGLIVGFNYDLSFFTGNIISSISIPKTPVFSLPHTQLTLPPSLPPPIPLPSVLSPPPPPLPDISLKHNKSDEELVLIASKVDGNSNNTPKIAFMFMVKGPIHLAPLWEKFFEGNNGNYSIYVHTHPSYNRPYPKDSVFYGRSITSQEVIWGTMSMVDAEKRLLGNALLDPSNQRFVLLSESCIPLFNFTTVYNYLFRTNLSFLGSIDILGRDGRGRYNKTMSPDIVITQWRKGPQWFEAHRDLALKIILERKFYSLFEQHCRKPCFSDEHYLPTMANILCPEMIQNRSLTWVDWSHGGPHPSRYGWGDINVEFFTRVKFGSNCTYNGEVTSTCFLFARKFLPSALEPLLRIAPSTLGFGS